VRRVVLDTNVLVSGLLSDSGPPARILDLWIGGEVQLVTDTRIEREYRDVLARRTLGIPPEAAAHILDLLDYAEQVVALPLPVRLPDADDEPFLEVAVAAAADALVTGNVRHFAVRGTRWPVRVLTPREFIDQLRS
jgi:putative PIN family toxin of toxin-antitoxin system